MRNWRRFGFSFKEKKVIQPEILFSVWLCSQLRQTKKEEKKNTHSHTPPRLWLFDIISTYLKYVDFFPWKISSWGQIKNDLFLRSPADSAQLSNRKILNQKTSLPRIWPWSEGTCYRKDSGQGWPGALPVLSFHETFPANSSKRGTGSQWQSSWWHPQLCSSVSVALKVPASGNSCLPLLFVVFGSPLPLWGSVMRRAYD